MYGICRVVNNAFTLSLSIPPFPAANFHVPRKGAVFEDVVYTEIYGVAADKIVRQYREDALGLPSYPTSKRGRYDRGTPGGGGGRYGGAPPQRGGGGGGYPPYPPYRWENRLISALLFLYGTHIHLSSLTPSPSPHLT